MTKVAEVLADFQGGRRQRPASLAGYMYKVCENALVDYQRRMEDPSRLTKMEDAEIADLTSAVSVDVKEGDEEYGGFRAFRAKPSLSPPRPKRAPYLMRLIRVASQDRFEYIPRWERGSAEPAWELRPKPPDPVREAVWEAMDVSCWSSRAPCHLQNGLPWDTPPPCATCPISEPWRVVDQAEKRLAQLPVRAGQAARPYLQGVREAQIARRLGISRAAVTKLLKTAREQWGWDRQAVELQRLRLMFANLFMAVSSAMEPFRSKDEGDEGDFSPSDWPAVSREEEARKRSVEEMRRLTSGPERRGCDPLALAHRQACERAVHNAITSSPWLASWARGLEPDHIPQVVEFVEDCYYPDG